MGNETAMTVTSICATAALGITSIFCPPLGMAMAISSTAVGATGAVVGSITKEDDLRDVGLAFVTAGVGGIFGGSHCSHCPKK